MTGKALKIKLILVSKLTVFIFLYKNKGFSAKFEGYV
jgi:hypothetical protein